MRSMIYHKGGLQRRRLPLSVQVVRKGLHGTLFESLSFYRAIFARLLPVLIKLVIYGDRRRAIAVTGARLFPFWGISKYPSTSSGSPGVPAGPDRVVVRSWWLPANYRLHLTDSPSRLARSCTLSETRS